MRSAALYISALLLLGLARPVAATFAPGDLYLLSTDLPGLATGIVQVDPVTGATSTLLDPAEGTTNGGQLAFDPFRDRLLITDIVGTRAVDSSGTLTTILAGPSNPIRIAARGDGILYLWYPPGTPFRYLDASDVSHDLLNEAGSGPQLFAIGADVEVMLYHASTNSLILVTEFGFGPCVAANDTCAIKMPLTPDGTQVAGPLEFVQINTSASSERPQGIGYGPGDSIFFAVDTNSNDQEPRMQLLDPTTMTLSTYASSGAYTGAAVISAGIYSNVTGVVLLFDTFFNVFRTFTLGETGEGTILSAAPSGSGHSELARLIEIPLTAVPSVPALGHAALAFFTILLAAIACAYLRSGSRTG